jgi:hypothetical protein
MFSKHAYDTDGESKINARINHVKQSTLKADINTEINKITYDVFFKNKIMLSKYKIPELKEIAKCNKLHISGSKPKLISRIEMHFQKELNAIKIQKNYRKYIVRKLFSLRGAGLKNRDRCVNSTDFYTMEPICEIPHYLFFSYSDSNKFTYGFDITSLVELIKHNHNTPLTNPYNREEIEDHIKNKIVNLYNITHIIFPHIIKDTIQIQNNNNTRGRNLSRLRSYRNYRRLNNNFEQTISYSDRIALITKMNELRSKSIEVRIQELFIEIDLLGNYTQASWLSELSRSQYLQLYQWLYNIWYFRGFISREVRRMICCLNDPFYGRLDEIINITNPEEITLEVIKESCLYVIENMVHTGIDIEYRKIGTFHALSALTIVSEDARQNMQWLYDSII